jgi:biopolymer transport protein ExbD
MRFSSPRTTHPKEVTFDLTNMIDVVLLLIIFFMLTAQFAKSVQSEMDLPKESGDAADSVGEAAVVIDMDRAGQMAMLGAKVDLNEVTRTVRAALDKAGSSPLGLDLVIRADRACPAAHLNRLAEALAGMGVRTWKLATQSEGSSPAQ